MSIAGFLRALLVDRLWRHRHTRQTGFLKFEHIRGEEGKPGAKPRILCKNRGRDVELIETMIT